MNLPCEIGPFEILESLGAGGMGEVFKARDKRLNRFVAIKFLPEHAPALARERFQREAQAIAALNHSHICTLHEVGDDNGRPYLVLELLEGETLRARLRRGALAPELLLDFGLQIADALQAAHAKGVLHRDLKPDNIWVGPGNHIKVLDFGLARLESPEEAAPDDVTLTSPGMTLGTIPYMSPEQARGEPLDARSDLFSFGSVLYEMATGRQPFLRANAAETTAAILKEQPPALAPDEIGRVIGRLLEKDPDLRYQSAADLRGELKRMKRTSESSAAVAPVAKDRGGRRWTVIAIAVIVIVGGGLALWRLRPHAAPPAPALSFHQLTFNGQVEDAAISPDGKFLAYLNAGTQGTSLHLLSTVNGSDTQIMPPAPGCCESPSFSPDGSLIYFVSSLTLGAVPVLGGAVRTLAAVSCDGAGVSADGSRIAYVTPAPGGGDALTVANADGTQAHVLSRIAPDNFDSHCWGPGLSAATTDEPAWSPDGRWIALEGGGPADGNYLVLVDAANGHTQRLGPNFGWNVASDLAWLPDGSGIILTAAIPATSPSQAWEMTYPGGKLIQLTHDLQGYDHAGIAAQAGGAIALVHANPRYSVWAQAKPGGAFAQLPGGGASHDGMNGVAWTPQGQILSVRSPGGRSQLWLAGGAAPARMLAIGHLPETVLDPLVAPDGQIVFTGVDAGANPNLWRVSAEGTGLTDLTPGMFAGWPTLVEDGKAVAFIRARVIAKSVHTRAWVIPLAGGTARLISPVDLDRMGLLAVPGGERLLAAGGKELALDGSKPVALPGMVAMDARLRAAQMAKPFALTPDGRVLTGVVTNGSVGNIWALPLGGGPAHQVTHFTDLAITAYAFSKDGRLAISRGTPNSDAVLATGLVHKP